MQIWPAIDLRGGMCVRLRQGDYSQETVFGHDPAGMARRWVDDGADRLHLVDLDGARRGLSANRDAVQAILSAVQVPCQVGGGIRDESGIRDFLDLGVDRVVLGTQAVKQPQWFCQMCRRYPHKLAIGLDARDGFVATEGWQQASTVLATALADQFKEEPVAAIVYTDIARDGMLRGPNLAAVEELNRQTELPVIASGGVSTTEDVRQLAQLGVAGCIIGRSLYEGQLTLGEAFQAASPMGS